MLRCPQGSKCGAQRKAGGCGPHHSGGDGVWEWNAHKIMATTSCTGGRDQQAGEGGHEEVRQVLLKPVGRGRKKRLESRFVAAAVGVG